MGVRTQSQRRACGASGIVVHVRAHDAVQTSHPTLRSTPDAVLERAERIAAISSRNRLQSAARALLEMPRAASESFMAVGVSNMPGSVTRRSVRNARGRVSVAFRCRRL